MFSNKPVNDGFIDDSVRKQGHNGEPIEWVKPDFTLPHGMLVEEITLDEFLEARKMAEALRASEATNES